MSDYNTPETNVSEATATESKIDFIKLINEKLATENININQLSVKTGQSRDSIYRFLKGITKSMHSETLGAILDYLGYEVVEKKADQS